MARGLEGFKSRGPEPAKETYLLQRRSVTKLCRLKLDWVLHRFFSFFAGSCLVIDFSMDRVLCRHIAADRSGLSMFDRLVRAFHGGSPTRGSFHKVALLLQRSLVSSFIYGSSSQELPSGR